MVVAVAEATAAKVTLNLVLSFAVVVTKLVPLIDTAVAGVPMVGVKLVIVGAPLVAVTVNDVLLVAEPLGVVILMGPLIAPAGTAVTI